MNAAGPGGRKTHPQSSGIFRIRARHERSGFFVSHLDKPDLVLPLSQRLHDPVDAVTRQSENRIYAPVQKRFDEYVRCSRRHLVLSLSNQRRGAGLRSRAAINRSPRSPHSTGAIGSLILVRVPPSLAISAASRLIMVFAS